MTTSELIVTAPLGIDVLKDAVTRKLKDRLIIDVDQSGLTGPVLLTYVTNLDVGASFKFESDAGYFDLLRSYFKATSLHSFPQLETGVAEALGQIKGIHPPSGYDYTELLCDPELIPVIKRWLSVVESLNVYMACTGADAASPDNFSKQDDIDLTGINVVKLIGHDTLPLLLDNASPDRLFYYSNFFENAVFRGSRLKSYWEVSSNILYVMSVTYDEKLLDTTKLNTAYDSDLERLRKLDAKDNQ